MLNRIFKIREAGSSIKTEAIAGLTTFITMAYIIFVNPQILTAGGKGPELSATIAATCIGAAVPTIFMGLVANYPFALASGMGLNAALAGLIITEGLTWQAAMGVVFVEGVLVTLLVISGAREAVMKAIPINLKRAIGVGIGLFIAFIGMRNAGWVEGAADSIITFGTFDRPEPVIAVIGLLITLVLMAWRIKGAILIGILGTTVVGILAGVTNLPGSITGLPDFSTFGKVDVLAVFRLGLWGAVFAFLMTDFFDTMGTVIGVGDHAKLLDQHGNLPKLKPVLLIDSLAAVWGSIAGASSVTTYIESAAGVGEGGRTGLMSIVVGLLFLLALLFTPLIGVVPAVGTAPALIVVGFLMMSVVKDMHFDRIEDAFPSFLILLVIPLTQSISHGIGYGFITYTLIKTFRGQWRDIHPLMFIASLVFAISFIVQR